MLSKSLEENRTRQICYLCAQLDLVLISEREGLFTVEFPCGCHVHSGDATGTYLILIGAARMRDHTAMVQGQLPGACDRRVCERGSGVHRLWSDPPADTTERRVDSRDRRQGL